MLHSRIIGTGSALPRRCVSNDELARELAARGIETSDEWIATRTGIRQRYLAGLDETTASLAERAARAALEAAGAAADSIDLIVLATTTPDQIFPSTACLVQERLGNHGAAAFDLHAVCSGFVYALTSADALIKTGAYRRALVIGAETLSRILDWNDRSTCVLFGDGAGAVVLEAASGPGILAARLHADGGHGNHVLSASGRMEQASIVGDPFIRMDGRAVFRLAVESLESSAREVLEAAGLQPSDLSHYLPHQANLRIMSMVARKLGVPMDKVLVSVDRHGNTSAASVPLALDAAVRSGRIKSGDTVLVQGVGAGFTWASALIRW